ncbi:MAG: hypothetical protein AAB425_06510, partial [Bdellovibrionota bacterium]
MILFRQLLPILVTALLVPSAPAEEVEVAATASPTTSPSGTPSAQTPGITQDRKFDALAIEGNRGCLPSHAVIEDLRKKRDELVSEGKKLVDREKEIALKERALDEELRKLKDLKDDILASRETQGKLKAENIERLGQTLETMIPKISSQILVTIDEGLAVAAMEKVSAPKLAKIMNVIDPDKATRLLERLAGVIR